MASRVLYGICGWRGVSEAHAIRCQVGAIMPASCGGSTTYGAPVAAMGNVRVSTNEYEWMKDERRAFCAVMSGLKRVKRELDRAPWW